MKVRVQGLVHTTERVELEVDPIELHNKLFSVWLASINMMGHYIEDGKWTRWEDTGHGSGLTTHVREATDDEVKVYKSFKVINGVINEIKSAHTNR